MTNSTNLSLPYILAAQAQKHVTHNEAIKALDILAQLSVVDNNLSAPPQTPIEGDCYIIASSPTGEWADKDHHIAAWQDGIWVYYAPQNGWICWVESEEALFVYDGTAWLIASSGDGVKNSDLADGTLTTLGVNAVPDTTNRLSINSPAILFNKETDDIQVKLNKDTSSDTASFLFQTNFSGRAEMGTAGDDNFHFKVSSDGSSWKEGLVINASTGEVTFPHTTIGGSGGGGGGSSTANNNDINMLALRIADIEGDRMNMVDGIADPFDDESDVDTANSSGQTYEAAGDKYTTNLTDSPIDLSSATATASGSYGSSYGPDNAIDGNNSTFWLSSSGGSGWLTVETTTAKQVYSYSLKAHSSGTLRMPLSWTFLGSNDGSTWTTLDTVSTSSWSYSEVREFIIESATAYTYHKLNVTSSMTGAYINLGALGLNLAPLADDMNMQSGAFIADNQPSTARLSVLVKPIDSISLNTDLIASVSRDDGTTWSTATLVEVMTQKDGTKMYVDDDITISGQPTGTDMKWKLETHNNKKIEFSGVVMQWS